MNRLYISKTIHCGITLFLLWVGTGLAAPLTDPFLEKFRVGSYNDPEKITMQDGWPAELFTPLVLDENWLTAASEFCGPQRYRQSHRLWTWRILAPALGTIQDQVSWYDTKLQRLETLTRAVQGEVVIPPQDFASPFLVKAISYQVVFNLYKQKRYDDAAKLVTCILTQSQSLDLTAEEFFVWSLRSRVLFQLAEVPTVADGSALWPELYDLGPYDAQTGWAIWVARQQATENPILPPGSGSKQLALFLVKLRRHWLDAESLARAGFSDDAMAGLGGLALSTGPALDAHYQRFPQPPADGDFQEHWLRGQRRRHKYAPANTEELAQLPGVSPTQRLDMWRRASEARLLRDDWDAGLMDLDQALSLKSQSGKNSRTKRLDAWIVQALVLAVAQENRDAADRIIQIAANNLHGEAWQQFETEAKYWSSRLGDDSFGPLDSLAETADLYASARRKVRSGQVDDLKQVDPVDLNGLSHRHQELLWKLWIQWGLNLIEDAGAAACRGNRCQDYLSGLRAASRATIPAARYALTCATIGRYLRGFPQREKILIWIMSCDLSRLSQGQVTRDRSVMAGLARQKGDGGLTTRLDKHALLGICLATGDSRGQLAQATALPQSSLSQQERLLFLYPLPLGESLLGAIAALDLELPLVLSVIRNESLFDPVTRSRAGALGLLQIMPFHYPDRGFQDGSVQWSRPETSLGAGSRLLLENLRRYSLDPYRTVAAYNAGGGAVDRWDRQLGGPKERDIFLAWIGYPETRRYTEKVLIGREIYDWILSGDPHRPE